MVIRRRSDTGRVRDTCRYHESFAHEMANHSIHISRQDVDPGHDDSPCWCCCTDCTDLTWHHLPRKGVWWQASPSGGHPSTPETSAESPGSAGINMY